MWLVIMFHAIITFFYNSSEDMGLKTAQFPRECENTRAWKYFYVHKRTEFPYAYVFKLRGFVQTKVFKTKAE